MDLHAAQIQGYFDIPLDHLHGGPILAEHFKKKNIQDLVVVSPDLGSVGRARTFAEQLDAPLAIIDKRRPKANVSEVMNIIGEVKDKNVILIDDMIDTAGTLVNGAEALKKFGAKEVYSCCTHPVLSGPAIDRIEKSVLKEVVVLDTLPLSQKDYRWTCTFLFHRIRKLKEKSFHHNINLFTFEFRIQKTNNKIDAHKNHTKAHHTC